MVFGGPTSKNIFTKAEKKLNTAEVESAKMYYNRWWGKYVRRKKKAYLDKLTKFVKMFKKRHKDH